MVGKMTKGRGFVAELVAAASTDEKIGSVESLSGATDLSTGSVAKLLREFIASGLVVSERGRGGGYWRTDKPMTEPVRSARAEMAEIRVHLSRALEAVQRLEGLLVDSDSGDAVSALPGEQALR